MRPIQQGASEERAEHTGVFEHAPERATKPVGMQRRTNAKVFLSGALGATRARCSAVMLSHALLRSHGFRRTGRAD
jgi:hypothetical protein